MYCGRVSQYIACYENCNTYYAGSRGMSQVRVYWNAIACFGIATKTFIEILYCRMLHLLPAYIAQHMILPWHVIGYHSLGCYCTSYGIVI